uniref:Citrate transporter-like domain-containing protein n=1 Tax=Hanusia phi TaxID=3032 RepID=A0A7S0F5B9_9CRYP|mmetsp:Transcript_36758/g.82811  ORF Transcript_36758/g.82811 Transcript_36758/m.82811 type:complete len:704 (+) Transcript_36758:318-2429(+)
MASVNAWQPWFVACMIFVLFVLLVSGVKTPETVAFMCMCIIWNAGIISTSEALAGFSNSGVLAIGVLFVVVQAIERTQLAPWAARNVFGMKTGIRSGLLRLCTLCFVISAFLNNTPVVALLTPITRDWARMRGFPPSLFLIPLSFSTILGGLLTIIGTSTNLVVVALAEDAKLYIPSFFETAYIGLPAGVMGVLYLVLVGPALLPRTGGMFRYMKDKNKELITEVTLPENFAYIGQPVDKALTGLGLHKDVLIKIRRKIQSADSSGSNAFTNSDENQSEPNSGADVEVTPTLRAQARVGYVDIYPVPSHELLQVGDTLFLSGGRNTMMALHSAAAAKNLNILNSDVPELAQDGIQFFEVVLSNRNAFVGDVVAQSSFGQFYGCSLLALRQKGRSSEPVSTVLNPQPAQDTNKNSIENRRRMYGEIEYERECSLPLDAANFDPDDQLDEETGGNFVKPIEVSHSRLHAGDVILALANAEFGEKWADSDDFLMITALGAVPKPPKAYDYFPVFVFCGMVAWVVVGNGKVDMVKSAMTAAAVLIAGGWIDAKKAVGYVSWDLMLLIGSMLGISRSITTSGLADILGSALRNTGVNPIGSIFMIYAITTVMTEITTNNAAAGLIFPLVIDLAAKLGVSYKPYMFTIMAAASSSFITPIGYQTNMMVWGPGGYKYIDFMKIGIPLNILHMIITCLLVTRFWPFHENLN